MYTIGTAGHVDHGKSTLVKALTGIDPDRLREEKERGMTIDLGFAWLTLPSGREISIVDVPGHERFIKNMLAGVGGIDLALLVVAADEGVMPQTAEHLAIVDLLRVKRGVVAVTKVDLVDDEWLELVLDDVTEHLKGTTLQGSPIVAVSAITRQGLEALQEAIDRQLSELTVRRDIGRPRLPVDRVFSVPGFGTVVTGTLIDGELRAGQELQIQPSGLKTRARGLQVHRRKVDVVRPGNRVAVNVAGLSVDQIRRGEVVTTPGWLLPTRAVDVDLKLLNSAPKDLSHNAIVSFHVGSAEVMAKVALLDRETLAPGERCWAQIRLADPLAASKGDLFVIRSPETTLGGGEIVDTHPKRHRRFQAAVVRGLELLQRGTPEDIVLQALHTRVPLDTKALAQRSGLPADQVQVALTALRDKSQIVSLGDYSISAAGWNDLLGQVREVLGAYHAQYPLRRGMPREELKSRLALPAKLFNEVVGRLLMEEAVVEEEAVVRLGEHRVQLSAEQENKVEALIRLLEANRYGPPSRQEAEQQVGLEPEVVEAMVERGRLVKVGDNLVFTREVYDEMVTRVIEHASARGRVTVGEVRDLLGTSRKYALALMEYLDEIKVTRRIGDERVLRQPAGGG